jgi:hypothetical protein
MVAPIRLRSGFPSRAPWHPSLPNSEKTQALQRIADEGPVSAVSDHAIIVQLALTGYFIVVRSTAPSILTRPLASVTTI